MLHRDFAFTIPSDGQVEIDQSALAGVSVVRHRHLVGLSSGGYTVHLQGPGELWTEFKTASAGDFVRVDTGYSALKITGATPGATAHVRAF
jgi:hypothetical protein